MNEASKLLLIKKLKSRFSKGDLPGYNVQKELTPPYRAHSDGLPSSKKAGVMLILAYDDDGELALLFIERAAHDKDNHSGQISFPGGQFDPNTDRNDLKKTALREVKEEIGIQIDESDVLGKLTNLYVPVSDFIIYPYVAVLQNFPKKFKLEAAEVKSILIERIENFKKRNAVRHKTITVRNYTLNDVPYYNLQGHTLWGATAMITAELVEVLKDQA